MKDIPFALLPDSRRWADRRHIGGGGTTGLMCRNKQSISSHFAADSSERARLGRSDCCESACATESRSQVGLAEVCSAPIDVDGRELAISQAIWAYALGQAAILLSFSALRASSAGRT